MPEHVRYPQNIQKHFLACLLDDESLFVQCRHMLKNVFDDPLVPIIRYMENEYDRSSHLPPPQRIEAQTGIEIKLLEQCDSEWFLREFNNFVRYRLMENAILEGLNYLNNGNEDLLLTNFTKAYNTATDKPREYPRRSLTDLINETTPDHLVPDLLFEQQVSMIYGESRNLKSFLLLHIASCLAHGLDWSDHQGNREPLTKRRIIYVAAEGGAMFGMRRLAWMKHNALDLEDDGFDVVDRPLMLLDRNAVQTFINEMRDVENLGLVAFDVLSACIAGNSDSNDDVASLAIEHMKLIARELKCHVTFVHHEGKDASRGYRGSSALFANVDTVIHVERLAGTLSAKATVVKQKDGNDGIVFSFLGHIISLDIHDRRGNERTSIAIDQINPKDVSQVEEQHKADSILADRHSIACIFTEEGEMSVNKLADAIVERGVWRHANGKSIGKTIVRERIIEALPVDTQIAVRVGDQIAQLVRPPATHGAANLVRITFQKSFHA